MGGVVGLGTAIFAFGIGPSVALGLSMVGKASKTDLIQIKRTK